MSGFMEFMFLTMAVGVFFSGTLCCVVGLVAIWRMTSLSAVVVPFFRRVAERFRR